MLKSFRCPETERIWLGEFSRKLPADIQDTARRKLRMLNNSRNINDLRVPPHNHLELLKGDRKGQFSIRINRGWRVCFNWINGECHNVEIVNYH